MPSAGVCDCGRCTLQLRHLQLQHSAGSLKVLVRGEAVQPEPVPLSVAGGTGCSLAWLGQPPGLRAGEAATMLVETRDAAGQRIQHVSK